MKPTSTDKEIAMSAGQENQDINIPAGSALTFAAPEGGSEWKLRNTELGLVIETGNRPIGRLTPEGMVVRGDMIVDGEIRRELDCHKFVGEWTVVEGHSRNRGRGSEPDQSIAIIRNLGGGKFEIGFRDPKTEEQKMLQTLRFNPRTGTLDDDDPVRGGPDRCISFWDCKTRGGATNRIFAMRRGKGPGILPVDAEALETVFLPWELTTDENGKPTGASENGTWGAEGG